MTKTVKAYVIAPLCFLAIALMVISCYPPQPHNTGNVCDIFKQYPAWYWDAKKTEAKYGVPVPVQMAIIHQESSFQATAEPPATRKQPTKPVTSALGYCQALNGTWECYKRTGETEGNRDQFAAASDFIGWYAQTAERTANIKPTDAYNLYLSYHEGIGGYREHSYLRKPWLIQVAHRVESYALTYAQQLKACAPYIPQPSLYQPGR